MPKKFTDREIRAKVETALDEAENVWGKVADRFLSESTESIEMKKGGEVIPSLIPGFPFVKDGEPQVANFIALVLDIREATKHLTQSISAKEAKASQLERVLYETTAVNTAGAMIVESYSGGVTEFLGDGFLAFFRVKERQNYAKEEAIEVYNAYDAAKQCLSVTRGVVNEILLERYRLPALNIGIGLAFSKALVTIIGTENNLHPKAIGECVYRASKLANGKNEIFIDKRLMQLWPQGDDGVLNFLQFATSFGFDGYKISHK